MAKRLPFRDPRTVARDIPGVLDILFPRLTGGLVAALNRTVFTFDGISAVSNEKLAASELHKAMLFELSVARAERILQGEPAPNWEEVLAVAVKRQRRHFDAKVPDKLEQVDLDLSEHAASNLVQMLRRTQDQQTGSDLLISPLIAGLGWISSGFGDFALGHILIEVKHTDRNFTARDFRQVLMYWLLKYSASIERSEDVWTACLLLNPRRNSGLLFNFDEVLHSASASSNRVELLELLRSIVGEEPTRR
ncbi:hypothetical protein [Pontivivens insulae]|uniref:Uncharacterized protein n=1 Tax=Pontivivens insulae TaxID=1639689 RepID=A0A2R8ACK2_9RHOB|nr:hypothetical protein [Pontivivens insulae]RED13919.1 hypothetical protein DFR53_1267 [Pontivivens insulae]SPF29993.1 hypothetical protein POI8812_02320 [Pontivivens insulae]